MDRKIYAFPHRAFSSSPRNTSSLAADLSQPILNAPRRLYLYKPSEEELIQRSLDLASQIGIAVSQVDREIIDNITRDRLRRIFPNPGTCADS
jgi:hypothetical protein